jgi:DNA-binding MarR family transcriptional regulator
MHLQLSPGPGQNLLEEVIPLAQAYEQQLLATLTPKEQGVLSNLLTKLQQKAANLTPPI